MKQCSMKVIGLTGGIATGKSTVSQILLNENQAVIDADIIAREVVKVGSEGYKDIKSYFGDRIILPNKEIDRKKLGAIVFNDSKELEVLNQITHPKIFMEIRKQLDNFIDQGLDYVFIDMPLLFEQEEEMKKYGIYFDEIWLVYLDRKRQIERLVNRDKVSIEDALKRIDAQMDINLKRDRSHVVLVNDKEIYDLKVRVLDEVNRLQA